MIFPPFLLLLYTSKQEFQLFCSFIFYPYLKKPLFLFLLWLQCKMASYFQHKNEKKKIYIYIKGKKKVLGFKVLKFHLISLFMYLCSQFNLLVFSLLKTHYFQLSLCISKKTIPWKCKEDLQKTSKLQQEQTQYSNMWGHE